MSDWWSADPVASAPQDDYGKRISSIESGGNYRAVGPQTGKGRALGKYQVMDFNVGPWTKEALGQEMTPMQFLSSPEAQEAVFKHKFGGYVQKYGPEGAARAWFAGEDGMNNPNARDILGTTVADYSRKFTSQGPLQASSANRQPQGNWWANDPVAEAPQQAAPQQAAPQQVAAQPLPEMQGPPRATVGMVESVVRGANQGASFNMGDEAAGLRAASGIPGNFGGIPGAIQAGIGAARMGADYLTGGTTAQDEYNRRVEIERERNKQAQEQNPGSYLGGNVAGAMVLPGGAALQGATLPARMLRGAGVGAGFGAASGAGEGEDLTDRAVRAGTGAAVGGVVGAAAPPLLEGAIQAGRAVVAPVVNAVRGAFNPEAEASRRVLGALQRDVASDPNAVNRLTPQEFAASVQSGGPARLMDIGGETTRGLARSAANTNPEGRDLLNRTINDRFEGQTERVSNWLRGTFNYPNADAQRQALDQARRTANNAAYQRAYREGSDGVWSPELERLAGSDAVSAAMQRAASVARDESIVSGYGAMNPRISFTPDGRMQFARRPNGMPVYPDLQYWDLVRRELSDAAQRAGRGTSEARRLNSFATSLNAELDRVVPSYREARQTAAAFFGAGDALEAGQNFVTQNFATAETRRALAQMSQLERQLFQDGFVSRFVETLERTGDRRNVLNQIASSPAAREKLNLVLGRQRANELEAGLRVEGIVDLARSAVQGNSTTARQLAELGLAGGTGVTGIAGVYNMDPGTMTVAALTGALLAGRRGIDSRVARHVAEMLVSDRPEVLMRGVRIVARNDRMLHSLRNIDRQIAKVSSVNGPGSAVSVQSIAPSRAEDQDVNRPRGQ
jgi:hypothetical protein